MEGFSFSHWCWRFLFQPVCGCLKPSSRSRNKRLVSTPEMPRGSARSLIAPLFKRSRLPRAPGNPLQQPAQRSKLQFRRCRQNQRSRTAAEAPAKLPPAAVEMAPPLKEAATEKSRAKEAILPLEIKHPQEAAPPSSAFAAATAICGLEARANEGQPKTEGADRALILQGADQAFERRFAEGFIQQSCLVRDLHQKAKQLKEKIKEAEEKRDKSIEQQSVMLTLSAERQRIEAERIAAEQTLNERLKEQKLARDFGLLQEKGASSQLAANAVPLANAKKLVALKCSNLLSRLQLGESDESDHDALRHCKSR